MLFPFYKYQVTRIVTGTADIRVVTNPVLNARGDVIAIRSLRLRLMF